MCGRYVSAGDLADLAVLLGANPFERDLSEQDPAGRAALARERRFNIAPTDPVPAVLPGTGADAGARQLSLLTWGLVPPWADPSTGSRRINARVETVLDKPAFRRAVRSRRVLLPADGWYEWVRRSVGRRQPYYVRPADGSLLAFAGLSERRREEAGRTLSTAAILTGPAPEALSWLHERAPIAVPAELWSDWLDPRCDPEQLLARVQAAPPREMSVYPVSTAVNFVRSVGPELTEPVEPVEPASPTPTDPAQTRLW